MGLTQEQIKLMEENRRKAMEKRAAKMAESNVIVNQNRNVVPASTKPVFVNPTSAVKCPTVSSFYSTPQSKAKSSWNSQGTSSKKFSANSSYTPSAANRPAASFQLISKTKFSVEAPFDNEMIEIFKKSPSKAYDATNRRW